MDWSQLYSHCVKDLCIAFPIVDMFVPQLDRLLVNNSQFKAMIEATTVQGLNELHADARFALPVLSCLLQISDASVTVHAPSESSRRAWQQQLASLKEQVTSLLEPSSG